MHRRFIFPHPKIPEHRTKAVILGTLGLSAVKEHYKQGNKFYPEKWCIIRASIARFVEIDQ
ncbi:hypothetical protein NECAME_06793 [Necator americanus]|uniref:Uncharacterized protein n=1 Tax=Necator americanus TaxID=51031 RepID=W2TUA2_NECAM|nr:hypothetical protein NECAME_06793 [Necator americanus]ETN84632.1 hypothetical protein NECAME_06793 [Necator americanus]